MCFESALPPAVKILIYRERDFILKSMDATNILIVNTLKWCCTLKKIDNYPIFAKKPFENA